jgi:hypothetical protein
MDAEQVNGLKQGMRLYGLESNKWNRMRNDPNLNLQNFTSAQLSVGFFILLFITIIGYFLLLKKVFG